MKPASVSKMQMSRLYRMCSALFCLPSKLFHQALKLSQRQGEISTTHLLRTPCKVKQITPLTPLGGSTLYALTEIYVTDDSKEQWAARSLNAGFVFPDSGCFVIHHVCEGRVATVLLLQLHSLLFLLSWRWDRCCCEVTHFICNFIQQSFI